MLLTRTQVPGNEQLASAARWKNTADDLIALVAAQDQQPGDLDRRPDAVTLQGGELESPPNAPTGEFRDRITSATLKKDGSGVQTARVETHNYYPTNGFGPSILEPRRFEFRDHGDEQAYFIHSDGTWGNQCDVRFSVDKASGDIKDYREHRYAMTFPEALKEVLTRPSGLILTAGAGVLAGLPFGLTGALAQAAFGPGGPLLAGLAGATATALVLAHLKTRPM